MERSKIRSRRSYKAVDGESERRLAKMRSSQGWMGCGFIGWGEVRSRDGNFRLVTVTLLAGGQARALPCLRGA